MCVLDVLMSLISCIVMMPGCVVYASCLSSSLFVSDAVDVYMVM